MRSGVCPGAMQLEIYQTGIGAHCPRLIKQEKAERTEYGCYSVTFVLGIPNALTF